MNIAPFFALIDQPGTPRSERLQSFVAGLHLPVQFEADGLEVLGEPNAPPIILPGCGLVWGTLFDRMTSRRIAAPAENQLASDSLDRFVERQWGGYVAIRKIGRAVEIFRDPSGAIPCYHARIDGTHVFTSRPEFLCDRGLVRPEIDWTIITQALVYRSLRPARTALREIDELMPGTAVTIEDGAARMRTIWSPWQFAAPEVEIASADDAVERVRRVVTSCVGAWARCFERPILEISGGLDSSIVAAVLAQAGAGPTCITFAAAEGDPDETPYAWAAADHLGFQLEVMRAEVADVDLTRSHAADLPRPSARGFAQAHETKLRRVAARDGADAFFSGGGGDNVFGYLRSVLPVIDRLKRGDPGLLGTIGDVAALSDVSIWEVVARSLARLVRVRRPRRWLTDERFLSRAALHELPFPQDHPWVDAPQHILPGKLVHGRAIVVIQNHLDGLDRLHDAQVISPLLSQPIVEICMAIPTWLWCDGGINRAIARRAFADALPPAVIERTSKGAFDTYCAQVFTANRGAIREMLLGGALARQGLLDTAALEAGLSTEMSGRSDMLRMLDLIDVEAWIAAWETRAKALHEP